MGQNHTWPANRELRSVVTNYLLDLHRRRSLSWHVMHDLGSWPHKPNHLLCSIIQGRVGLVLSRGPSSGWTNGTRPAYRSRGSESCEYTDDESESSDGEPSGDSVRGGSSRSGRTGGSGEPCLELAPDLEMVPKRLSPPPSDDHSCLCAERAGIRGLSGAAAGTAFAAMKDGHCVCRLTFARSWGRASRTNGSWA